jgi:hypothetical protein
MGWFGRDPDRCDEDVRREVLRDAKQRGDYDTIVTSCRHNWSTQREDDMYWANGGQD